MSGMSQAKFQWGFLGWAEGAISLYQVCSPLCTTAQYEAAGCESAPPWLKHSYIVKWWIAVFGLEVSCFLKWRWSSQLNSRFIFKLPPLAMRFGETKDQNIITQVAEMSFLPRVAGLALIRADILKVPTVLDGSLLRYSRHFQNGGILWQTHTDLVWRVL